MAEFSNFTITARGQGLMAKLIANQATCRFTAIKTSSTVYQQSQLEALTSLTNITQSCDISTIGVQGSTAVRITGAVNNTLLTTGYTVNTIGLYAIDPDLGEILYAVSRATTAGYMPPYNGITSSGIIFDFVVTVGNSSNVTVTINPAAVATQADIIAVRAEISDLAGYVGYTENDVYGVEVDFANRTFKRLAGAVGKIPGDDFDGIPAFGGRYRCNLTDDGVEVAKYGDAAYTETGALIQAVTIDGTTYPVGTLVQTMVRQEKFYYKTVPLVLEKNDAAEQVTFAFTAGASATGNITITLNGTAKNVAVASGNTAAEIAAIVRAASFPGWTVTGSGATATFTKNKVGAVTAATFTDTGSTGVTATVTRNQVGYIGKGFKMRKGRYYMSMTKKAGFKLHPAFIKGGVELDHIYLSAFEGCLYDVSASAYILDDSPVADFTASTGDKLSSIANAKPASGLTQDLTRRKCGVLAENRGDGWSQPYPATVACSQLLFTIEYASMNSQTKVGIGVTNKTDDGATSMTELTGATTNLGNESGSVTNTNGWNVVSYRGEENIWGNIWIFVDGANIYADPANGVHEVYIADDDFAESKNTAPYENAGITLATRNGYISAMAYSEEFDWLFYPAETLGDSALPVGDYFYQTAASAGYKISRLGGGWHYGSHAGAFYWTVDNAPSIRYRSIGGRLLYAPVPAA